MRFVAILTILAIAFLGFVAGAFITRFEVFPFRLIEPAFVAAEAVVTQRAKENPMDFLGIGIKPYEDEDAFFPNVRDTRTGVLRSIPDQAQTGYTLYTPVTGTFGVPLIDMAGNKVHEWQIPYDELDGPRLDGETIEAAGLNIAFPHLFANGDLLMVLNKPWHSPWGFGLIKIDKDSRLIWKFLKQTHHDVSIAPDGRIFAMMHEIHQQQPEGLDRLKVPYIGDSIVTISPDGEQLAEVDLIEAIMASPYRALLMYAQTDSPGGDLLHTNSITYIDSKAAEGLPFAKTGDILLSMRNIDTLAVLDPVSGSVTWAMRGPWHMQHDPDILANGNLLLFDNKGDLAHGGKTRIMEFDPRNFGLVWEYPGPADELLYTSVYGSQQRLANGNTLISETNAGRILEVTSAREVVWEFQVPERTTSSQGIERATAIFATRYTQDELQFEFGTETDGSRDGRQARTVH